MFLLRKASFRCLGNGALEFFRWFGNTEITDVYVSLFFFFTPQWGDYPFLDFPNWILVASSQDITPSSLFLNVLMLCLDRNPNSFENTKGAVL